MMSSIGQVCQRAGVTARTLRHWESLGLVTPALRTESGHRRYSEQNLERLLQIRALQQLGLSLGQIKEMFAARELGLVEVMQQRLERARGELAQQQLLVDKLELVVSTLEAESSPGVEMILDTMEVLSMYENYYSPEQLEELNKRHKELGEEQIEQTQQEWVELFASVRALLDAGADEHDPRLEPILARWSELVGMFSGGDPEIERASASMWSERGDHIASQHGLDTEVFAFVHRATQARQSKP